MLWVFLAWRLCVGICINRLAHILKSYRKILLHNSVTFHKIGDEVWRILSFSPVHQSRLQDLAQAVQRHPCLPMFPQTSSTHVNARPASAWCPGLSIYSHFMNGCLRLSIHHACWPGNLFVCMEFRMCNISKTVESLKDVCTFPINLIYNIYMKHDFLAMKTSICYYTHFPYLLSDTCPSNTMFMFS